MSVFFKCWLMSIIFGLGLLACGSGNKSPATPPPPVLTKKLFEDITAASGISFIRGYNPGNPNSDPEGFAGGMAIGDYDSDGDTDIFVVRGDIGSNLLYRNDGAGKFTEVAVAAGLASMPGAHTRNSGPVFVDINGDGYLDLFVGGLEGSLTQIYLNAGDGTFKNVTEGSGLEKMRAINTISASFGDYDRDGDLDLLLAHWGVEYPNGQIKDSEHLWRNDSTEQQIKFTSISLEAGLLPSILTPLGTAIQPVTDYSFSPVFADFNNDLYPDIVMVSDYGTTQVFLNNQDGTFTNATKKSEINDRNGMGVAVVDFNNDGYLDWFVTGIYGRNSFVGNRLYQNDGKGYFKDITVAANVLDGSWGWGACAADFNADMLPDIYHVNGWKNIFELDSYVNVAARLFFNSLTGVYSERAETFNINNDEQGRAVACVDLNGDRRIDVVEIHETSWPLQQSLNIWANAQDQQNLLVIRLKAEGKNRFAVGAKVKVLSGGVAQLHEVMAGANFTSQVPYEQTFALAAGKVADEVEITWPNGNIETFRNVPAGNIEFVQSRNGSK